MEDRIEVDRTEIKSCLILCIQSLIRVVRVPSLRSPHSARSREAIRPVVAMKQLTIVVKPFRAEAVLRVIAELGVTACAVRDAKGYCRQ